MNPSPVASRLGRVAVAFSTALVLVALAILPFLSPAWVGFEQDRTGVVELVNRPPDDVRPCGGCISYTRDDIRTVSNSILHDLVIGPPEFDVGVMARAVLTESERSHMRDVRGVFGSFFAAAAVGLAILATAFRLGGRRGGASWTRRDAWRGVQAGATGLAIGTVVAGIVAVVAFDAAFEVFHRLFFARGTYLFDPATSRLVQLFPDAFWSETAIAVGGVIVVVAAGTAWFAGRRLRAEGIAAPADEADEAASSRPAAAHGNAR